MGFSRVCFVQVKCNSWTVSCNTHELKVEQAGSAEKRVGTFEEDELHHPFDWPSLGEDATANVSCSHARANRRLTREVLEQGMSLKVTNLSGVEI